MSTSCREQYSSSAPSVFFYYVWIECWPMTFLVSAAHQNSIYRDLLPSRPLWRYHRHHEVHSVPADDWKLTTEAFHLVWQAPWNRDFQDMRAGVSRLQAWLWHSQQLQSLKERIHLGIRAQQGAGAKGSSGGKFDRWCFKTTTTRTCRCHHRRSKSSTLHFAGTKQPSTTKDTGFCVTGIRLLHSNVDFTENSIEHEGFENLQFQRRNQHVLTKSHHRFGASPNVSVLGNRQYYALKRRNSFWTNPKNWTSARKRLPRITLACCLRISQARKNNMLGAGTSRRSLLSSRD